MKNAVLILLALCSLAVSCDKTPRNVKVPVSYTVENGANMPLGDTYIPDSGTYSMPVLVKYLTGYAEDKVTISLSGLPADIKVAQDTFSEVPTYRPQFVFITKHAAHATYPITLTASAPGSLPKTYVFKLTVTSADCASKLWGTLSGSNACTARNYNYVATGLSTGTLNELNIVNFGGYGSNTTTHVVLNCNLNTVSIPLQNIGNGTMMQGTGTFNGSTMTVNYTATNTPGGFDENCNVTLTRQ